MRELWAGGEARTNGLLRVTALLFVAHLVDGGALKLPLGHGLELLTRFSASCTRFDNLAPGDYPELMDDE